MESTTVDDGAMINVAGHRTKGEGPSVMLDMATRGGVACADLTPDEARLLAIDLLGAADYAERQEVTGE